MSPLALGQARAVRHSNVGERELGGARRTQRKLVLDDARLEAVGALLDEKRRDAAVGCGPNDGDVRKRAVRDPELAAVDSPVAAAAPRVSAHAPGSEPPCASVSAKHPSFGAARELAAAIATLLVGAEREDAAHYEAALHGHAAANAAVAALELLADETVRRVAQAGAAVVVQRRAEQTELGEPRHELDGKTFGGEAVGDERRDFAIDEARNRVADQPLVVAEQRSDVEEIERIGVELMGNVGRPIGRPIQSDDRAIEARR